MKKLMFLSLILFSLSLFCQSGTNILLSKDDSGIVYRNSIGLAASSISGSGISYRYALNDITHLKFTGYIYYNEDKYESDLYSSIGTEVQFNLHKTDITRLYLLIGISYFHYETSYDDFYSNHDFENDVNTGIGIGLSGTFWKHIECSIDIGYKFEYIANNDYNWENNKNKLNTGKYIGIAGGIGIGYLF